MKNEYIIIDDLTNMSISISSQISKINSNLEGYRLEIDSEHNINFKKIVEITNNYHNLCIEIPENEIDDIVKKVVDEIYKKTENKKVLVLIDLFLSTREVIPISNDQYHFEKDFSVKIYKELLRLLIDHEKIQKNLYFFIYSRGEDGRNIIEKHLEKLCELEKNDFPSECYAKDVISFVTCSAIEEGCLITNDENNPLNIPTAFKQIIKGL